MATQKLNLTRDQLATFLKSHELIKQFERLFQIAEEVAPLTDTQGIQINAQQAQATANTALDLISTISQALALNTGAADQKANEALIKIEQLAQSIEINNAIAQTKAQQALDAISQLDQTLELLATGPVIENNNSLVADYIDFSTTVPAPAAKVGRIHWNGGYTLNLEMTSNVNQAIGESQFYYIKASGNINKGQLIMFDGSVGASGVLKGKPSTGVTNGQLIMGVAAESIANNNFGLVASFGLVRGFNTTGTPYGEVWADGDILYYNSSYAGGLTKNLPAAPLPHIVVAAVINASSAGAGSVFVRVQAEPLVSQLSDVYAPTPSNGDLLIYDNIQHRWENGPVPASSLPAFVQSNQVLTWLSM